MIAPTDFNLDSYIEYLEEIGQTHELVPVRGAKRPAGRYLAIQHDIDLSLRLAQRMAVEEAEHGIKATYCVQLGCAFYDILAPEGDSFLRAIRSLGHEIGLHFDPRRYAAAQITLEAGLRRDWRILRALGCEPRIVCAHKPLRNGLAHIAANLGMPSPQTEGETYVSDSARGFSDDGIAALEQPHDRIRINFHPAWWQPEKTRQHIIQDAASRATVGVELERRDWKDVASHPHAVAQDERDGVLEVAP